MLISVSLIRLLMEVDTFRRMLLYLQHPLNQLIGHHQPQVFNAFCFIISLFRLFTYMLQCYLEANQHCNQAQSYNLTQTPVGYPAPHGGAYIPSNAQAATTSTSSFVGGQNTAHNTAAARPQPPALYAQPVHQAATPNSMQYGGFHQVSI